MTISLPPLPTPELLADLCRETATAEGVEPQLVEKDFYLTRLIWALAQELGDQMLLKGGTLLSKVDLGFFRMSEDADFVLPGESSAFRKVNVSRMDRVRAAVKAASPIVGAIPEFPAGQLSHKAATVNGSSTTSPTSASRASSWRFRSDLLFSQSGASVSNSWSTIRCSGHTKMHTALR
jgi:hypothetical protein